MGSDIEARCTRALPTCGTDDYGVAVMLAGEARLFGSWALAIMLAIFAATNAIYFPLVEEPGLSRRFGDA